VGGNIEFEITKKSFWFKIKKKSTFTKKKNHKIKIKENILILSLFLSQKDKILSFLIIKEIFFF
jgi:hypothetical protein